MGDEIEVGHLSDRELLILVVQSTKTINKRLDAHAGDIKMLRWIAASLGGALGLTHLPSLLKGGGH